MVRVGSASLRGSTLRFASGARRENLAMSLTSGALARRQLPLGFVQALPRLAFALRTGIAGLSSDSHARRGLTVRSSGSRTGSCARIGALRPRPLPQALGDLMTRWSLKSIALTGALVVTAPIFLCVRFFENAGKFDSIGLWYTIYVTACFSAIVVGAVVLLIALAQWIARTKHGATGPPNKSFERTREG
jgi:hypothetical protein